ncbi:actin-binding LIM protein 1-like isoform X2 [Clytia hemisphaerica]|uniref:actin-binding LIM protein 1-like isoform X2 n=1 Tax=Clytia hemisphaerica TaxID=252671 RepID=UPI0034D3ED10
MVQQDVFCNRCQDSCYGDVVELSGNFYHQYCFTCKKCNEDLVNTGYFEVDGEFFCNKDYHQLVGTQCDGCHKFVEGNVITAMNSTFHPECFGCHRCGKVFPEGANIIYDGEDFLCETCDNLASPKKQQVPSEEIERRGPPSYEHHVQSSTPPKESVDITDNNNKNAKNDDIENCCAGCGNDIKSGQALLALDKQWHLWCFTCHKCGCLLAGEYMGRDGVPYCEQDYQSEFGVTCAGCGGYITGKVLQAGEKHYHPHCSRCAKCGDMFGEGEEMYLQGSEIWHPSCSEEFQRETEAAEKAARNGPTSPHLRIQTHQTPESLKPGPYSPNGYNNDSSIEPPESPSAHTWKPPASNNTTTNGYHKPPGFRSIKPPQIVAVNNNNNKPPKDASDEEDAPPPVPPPPSRSSSTAWKQKYAQSSTAVEKKNELPTPAQQKPVPVIHKPTTKPSSNAYSARKSRPLSFVESAAARASTSSGGGTYQITKTTHQTRIVSSSTRTISTTSSEEPYDERDNGLRGAALRKGVGFNKLQQRKQMKENSLARPSANGHENLDPEILRKLNADPNGNTYLTDNEFFEVFRMTRDKFYSQPKWKQEELKKRVTLF